MKSLFFADLEREPQKEEIIPYSSFYTNNENVSSHGLNAQYSSMKTHIAYTQKDKDIYAILLEWQDDKCILNIDKPLDGAKVSLLGRDGYLSWIYKNGQMIIDVTPIKYSEIPCHSAWTFKIAQ